jgi:hypothetical protein
MVERSTVIHASPQTLHAMVASPKAWGQWSAWNQRDPGMQIVYSGPERGAGAKWSWKSKTEGDGEMTITRVDDASDTVPSSIDFKLYFPDVDSTSPGSMTFSPNGKLTEVRWTTQMNFGGNPALHWMTLFGDKMVGPDFEAGLANLKALAEKQEIERAGAAPEKTGSRVPETSAT